MYRDFQMNWYCLLAFQFIQTVQLTTFLRLLCVLLKQGLFDILGILMIPELMFLCGYKKN